MVGLVCGRLASNARRFTQSHTESPMTHLYVSISLLITAKSSSMDRIPPTRAVNASCVGRRDSIASWPAPAA